MNRLFILFIMTLTINACTTTEPYRLGDTGEDGLAVVENSILDEVAIRPAQQFDRYNKVMIEPLTVSYDDRRRDSDRLNRRPEDFQLDEKELEIFNRKFVKAFQSRWNKELGWELTDQPGEDVVIVRASITDFYLFASIKNDNILPTFALANETSRMVLNLELIDSQSGDVLLRSKDKKTTGDSSNTFPLRRISSVRYWSDAYLAFQQWASTLSNYLTTQT